MGLPLTQFGPITLLLKSKNRLVFLFVALLLTGCTSVPSGIEPVQDFNLQRYLGKWYEVARYDHSFEQGLEQVTAPVSYTHLTLPTSDLV